MSWVDRLQSWVDGLPIHYTITYILLAFFCYGLIHVYFWLRGMIPFPTFSSLLLPGLLWVGSPLIIMHLTNNLALEAITVFQEATLSNQEVSRAKRQLIYMPAGWLFLVCLAVAGNTYLGISAYPEVLTPYSLAGLDEGSMVIISALLFFIVGALIFHSLHLVRSIGQLYSRAEWITVLETGRTYAFTPVTSIVVLSWGALIYGTIATVPGIVQNPVYTSVTAGLALIIIGSVILLLIRINHRLRSEKQEMRQRIVEQLHAVYRELDARYHAGHLDQAGAMRQVALAKKDELDFINGLSTWPWQPGTAAGVASALFLPAIIVLIQEITMRLLS